MHDVARGLSRIGSRPRANLGYLNAVFSGSWGNSLAIIGQIPMNFSFPRISPFRGRREFSAIVS